MHHRRGANAPPEPTAITVTEWSTEPQAQTSRAMSSSERRLKHAIAPGERIYAVGDIHGCFIEFERLVSVIRSDAAERAVLPTRILLLGDVIDRGPASSQALAAAKRYAAASERFTVLLGNHEQLMVQAMEGDQKALASWLSVGGGETLISFGVDAALVREGACDALLEAAQRSIGPDMLAWLLRLPLSFRSGDVVFVHAGVRRGAPVERQTARDLLWMREPFLSDTNEREYLVVHGHTVYPEGPDWNDHRIGVDTGAYATGRLSAIGIEGDLAWPLSSRARDTEEGML